MQWTFRLTGILGVLSIAVLLFFTLVSNFSGYNFLQNLWGWMILLAFPSAAAVFLSLYVILLLFELFSRIRKDKITNYLQSRIESIYFRHFLQLDEYQNESTIGYILNYNSFVSFLTVNVTEDFVEIFLPLPFRVEAMKELQRTLPLIRETASNRMKDYTFQTAERGSWYFRILGRRNNRNTVHEACDSLRVAGFMD